MNTDARRPNQILQMESNDSELRLIYGWRKYNSLGKLIIVAIGDIVGFGCLLLFPLPGQVATLMALILIPFGIFMAYRALTEYYNISTFNATSTSFQMKITPIPTGGINIPTSDIEAIYRRRVIHQGRRYTDHYITWTTYDVRLKTRDGKDKRLAGNMDAQPAKYIEHQLTRFLKLRPQPEQ
jgi:hypothetical protein